MGNKIKIGYLIASSEIGGTEKMLLTISKHLDKNIFEVVFFCIKGRGKFTEKIKKENFKIHVFNLKKNPVSLITLFICLKKEKLDILQSFLFVGNIIGRIYGKILRVNVISSQRSTEPWRKWYHWFLERITKNFASLIISNSYYAKEILIRNGRIKRRKIKVIPNGIEIPENLEKVNIVKNDIIIGTVGNLRKAKGHIYLIKSAKIVVEKFKNVRFYIVGEGELKDFIIKKIKEEKLQDYFVLTGFVENVSEYLKIFDIFVLPSLWEGCPVSLLEAMSYGLPCIATNVGDIPYIIENGKDGFIVEKTDYRKIGEILINLIKDRSLREKIGNEAKVKIKKYYSFEKMVNSYASIYKGFANLKKKE